jgi:hypothetical protein
MKPYSINGIDEFYFCTDTIVGWQYVFTSHEFFEVIIQSFKHCQREKGLNVHAYVIMPNHVHSILSATKGNLAEILRDFKRFTSRAITDLLAEHWTYSSARNYILNAKYFHNTLPSWNNFASHPNNDEFWKRQALASRLTSPTVPTLHVAGWWDQEDFYGPQKAYDLLEKNDKKKMNYIVIGPWNHGGWAGGPGNQLGSVVFDTATGRTFRELIQRKWFAYYLKNQGDGNFPEAMTFQTGSNQWMTYTTWPNVPGAEMKKLYIQPDGKLSFVPPASVNNQDADSYVSDPSKPVPYRTRPVEETYSQGSRWRTWLVEDQRFVHNRPDVLSWETDVLSDDVTVTGQLFAHLFASTTGTDADWVVKLIDVYPDEYPKDPKMGGFQLMIANDVFRGRFRKSFEKPEPMTPGKVEETTVDLHAINHVFLKGHKIMVQVQSTWFPIIDRNPQKYVSNIFEAKESDFQSATDRIHRSQQYPTHIVLPVVTGK